MAEHSTHVSRGRLGDESPNVEGAPRPPLDESPPSPTASHSPAASPASETPTSDSTDAVETSSPTDRGHGAGDGAGPLDAPDSNGNSNGGGSAVLVSPEQQKTVISRSRPEGSSGIPLPSNPLEMAVVLEGQRLGHFELGQFVGGGGMGAVFRATDTMLDRTVAVKILSRNHTDDEIIRRFKNEAQSAARLDHPNIARVYYVGEDQGWNYIVFEFIEGENIRDLVERRGPLSLEEAFSYTLQIAEALEHASGRDVVHRDIKPSNVLIMPDGRAKLVDMGLARLHQVEAADNDLTASGVTLGTFDYISPEQARDPRSADVRSDLYSLGCTLYYMLTGRPPFAGTAIKKLLSHAGDAPPDVRTLRPEVPDEVVAVINKMMAKRPEARYQKPSELIGELLLLAEHLGLTDATKGGAVWITREHSRWDRFAPALVIVMSSLLLLGGVLAIEHYFSSQDELSRDFVAQPKLEEPPSTPAPVEPSVERPVPIAPRENPAPPSSVPTVVDVSPEGPPGPSPPAAEPPPVSPSRENTNSIEHDAAPLASNFLEEFVASAPTAQLAAVDAPAELTIRPSVDEIGFIDAAAESFDASLSAAIEPADADMVVAVEPTPPEVIVVGAAPEEAPEATIYADTLEDALRSAAQQPTVREIQVPTGKYDVKALAVTLTADGGDRQPLTIRGVGDEAPQLTFRPADDEFGILATRMVSLVGGRQVSFEGLRFRLDLPAEEAEQWSERWSLFHVQNLSSLTFSGCIMTIQNASQDGSRLYEKAAFVEVEPPLVGETPAAPLFLSLDNCIARGQAALVRADTATPFSVNWNQGLLVTTEPMIEAGGAAEEPGNGRIAVKLDHLTAVLPRGLCSLKTSADKKYQFILGVECRNSIILTESDVPLLTRMGPETLEEVVKKKLEVATAGNFYYPQVPIFCRVGDDLDEATSFSFDQAVDAFDGVSQLPDEIVMWKQDPALDAPAHLRRKQDFELSSTPHRALDRKAGFDPALLPETFEAPLPPSPAPAPTPVPMPPREMPVMPAMPEMPSPAGSSPAASSSPDTTSSPNTTSSPDAAPRDE
ncbi:MAG: protein kinase [Pirellulaceae bacterium]